MSFLDRLRKHLERKHIDPMDDRKDLSVGLYQVKKVPLKGSVHISSGRVVSRTTIEKKFKKATFA